ncbi:MAG TPA: transglycosylase SLT domain-containing protein [Gemmatimonadales bacterium]|nr:transglycosylase SLT domain-containing protein [Gemmatimonadales bacterium]
MQRNPWKTRLALVAAAAVLLVAGLRRPLLTPPEPHLAAAPAAPLSSRTAGLVADLPVAAPIVISAPPVDSLELERQVLARHEHRPLAHVLRRRANDSTLADRIARALVREAERLRVSPSLLAGLLIVENPRLDVDTVSRFGAVGLMQVMDFHAGAYDCPSTDLRDVEGNICHGARVLGRYMKRWPDVRTALLRYNGCVRGTNTPNCQRYPIKVMKKASEVRQRVLRFASRDR